MFTESVDITILFMSSLIPTPLPNVRGPVPYRASTFFPGIVISTYSVNGTDLRRLMNSKPQDSSQIMFPNGSHPCSQRLLTSHHPISSGSYFTISKVHESWLPVEREQ